MAGVASVSAALAFAYWVFPFAFAWPVARDLMEPSRCRALSSAGRHVLHQVHVQRRPRVCGVDPPSETWSFSPVSLERSSVAITYVCISHDPLRFL